MCISIPKRHIDVWDSISSTISPEELDVYIEFHALGMPLSKKDFAKPNGKTMRDNMAVDIFKELPNAHEFENKYNDTNLEFSKKDFAKANGKSMRDKMAVDIFQELPDAHEFENKDMDDILEDLQLSRLDDLTISSLESLLSSDLL
ncbi:hypothetical protein F2Q70_00023221 [Brassica cretica]|uniref:Uncharacterized protein n=1 Tax=Brassica cretica TaxID=69181 RepID=A0A8S9GQ08_BRACR|nr:hypothetical protein F2Q70_00023221 [Brassica cretica]